MDPDGNFITGTYSTKKDTHTLFKENNVHLIDPIEIESLSNKFKRPALVFVYRDGCGWCEATKPAIYQLGEEMNGKNRYVYAVDSMSEGESLRKRIWNWMDKMDVTGVPTIFVYNTSGKVERYQGPRDLEHFIKKLESLK